MIIYISIRFEPKMAIAAIIALFHDLIITAGIYSLVGFEVTPVDGHRHADDPRFLALRHRRRLRQGAREHRRPDVAGRKTYAQAANEAVNQTLMRSINTSLIALLPVASLLFVGAGLLGAGTLKDLALAQLVGLASGAYSSIFIAAPLLVDLKKREPVMQQLERKGARARSRPAARPDSRLRPADGAPRR